MMIMALSSSISAFAAEPADIAYNQSDSAEIIEVDVDEILANAENPTARSVTLPASRAYKYNIGQLSKGQKVIINVKWSPVSSALHVGLVKSTSSTGNLVSVTGGSKSITATVNSAGTYYLMVANPSTTKAVTISELSYIK